jgi:hypothetical protein
MDLLKALDDFTDGVLQNEAYWKPDLIHKK